MINSSICTRSHNEYGKQVSIKGIVMARLQRFGWTLFNCLFLLTMAQRMSRLVCQTVFIARFAVGEFSGNDG